jgi:hypothetical protein
MSMEDTKFCRYCKTLKLKNEFQLHRGKCKPCRTLETKEWNQQNREKHNTYQKEYKAKRYANDINFKIKQVLRSRLRKALNSQWKQGSAVDLLGCSVEELKIYLESKFQPNMTWSKWSKTGWHIDHIIPLDSFNLEDPNQLKLACHYSNLQPLWSEDNCSKSNKVQ